MSESTQLGELYGRESRALQDQFDSRRLADRLAEITLNDRLDDNLRGFIESTSSFYLATVDSDGFPDVSHKGGDPGFVVCLDDRTILIPSFDGNGMFRSLGNIINNGRVAMLFVSFGPEAQRWRVQGHAVVHTSGPAVERVHGAEAVIEVTVGRTFPNCPRYLPDPATGALSADMPRPGTEPPVAEWKTWEMFSEVLPES